MNRPLRASVLTLILTTASAPAFAQSVDLFATPAGGRSAIQDRVDDALALFASGTQDVTIHVSGGSYGEVAIESFTSFATPRTLRVVGDDPTGADAFVEPLPGQGPLSVSPFSIKTGPTLDVTVENLVFRDWLEGFGLGAVFIRALDENDAASGTSPTVRRCRFENNRSVFSAYGGSGVAIGRSCDPWIVGCDFVGNEGAVWGGAIWSYGQCTGSGCAIEDEAFWPVPLIENCTFEYNYCESLGGAIAFTSSFGTVRGCSFVGNEAENHGGGIYGDDARGILIEDCKFLSNSALGGQGGAIYQWDDGGAPQTYVVRRTRFEGNTAGFKAGAIQLFNTESVVANNEFIQNVAFGAGAAGAAIVAYADQPGKSPSPVTTVVVGNLFVANAVFDTAPGASPNDPTRSAARFCSTGSNDHTVYFVNNTLTRNMDRGVTLAQVVGANLSCVAFNDVFWDNGRGSPNPVATITGLDVLADSGAPTFERASLTLIASITEQPIATGFGNVVADPRFEAPGLGNFRLSAGSPGVDTGSDFPWTTILPGFPGVLFEDLDRGARLVGTVDRGAYERP